MGRQNQNFNISYKQYVTENIVMTKSLRFENIKISVDFSFRENSGDGRNLSMFWVKEKNITDKKIETKA